jgi:ketosteroid isomerase-like protein
MSQENAVQVRRLYNDGWMAGNLDLALQLLHPEIVWTAIESAPDAGMRTGLDECRVYMEDWLEDFDFESHAIEVAGVALDDCLVCASHLVGTGKGSGIRTEIRYASTYRFAEDGRIIEIHEYATLDEAFKAAGLSG